MISLNSIKNFIFINFVLIFIGLVQYILGDTFLAYFSFLLIRNYGFIDIIEYVTNENRLINLEQPKETYIYEFDFYVISSTLMETILHIFIKYVFYHRHNNEINLIYDLFSFIIISFFFEIIFDFFHYSFHYFIHYNSYFYKNIHKVHHKFKYPSCITTFYQHPLDIIITNYIPIILTLILIPIKPSYFQYNLISVYKVYIEISGHLGKYIKSTSFPQFICLPKIFNIQLKVEDHDLHHSMNNCNYSKRFSLWDKIFGTYKNK